jgi:AraC family transcriptional regulator
MSLLSIKNMVCDRCISSVEKIFFKLKVDYKFISLGQYEITKLNKQMLFKLESLLVQEGFELTKNNDEVICSKIKSFLIELLNSKKSEKINISKHLTEKLNYSYNYLSKVFSNNEKTTIEKYFLNLKIEKIKELLSYKELSIKEISYKLNYYSVSHMSNHFKTITGLSPSIFRKKYFERKTLNQIG